MQCLHNKLPQRIPKLNYNATVPFNLEHTHDHCQETTVPENFKATSAALQLHMFTASKKTHMHNK